MPVSADQTGPDPIKLNTRHNEFNRNKSERKNIISSFREKLKKGINTFQSLEQRWKESRAEALDWQDKVEFGRKKRVVQVYL
ncbi:MAG: hypothetical protein HY351_03495 [Candidatus Omnitrophica bacterium]|nr:hypothetical protein [Candidatus Omnitrophota bacterium]